MAKKNMKITVEGDGFGSSVREWEVEEELVRPYCIAYDGWIAKGGIELSKLIYGEMKEAGVEGIEMLVGPQMITVSDDQT